MSERWTLDCDADSHTGTEVLFRLMAGVYPPRDVSEADVPKLLHYMRRMSRTPRASEHLIRFCGIGCPRTSVEDLAREHGFRERDIRKSLTIAASSINRWREAFFALYGIDERT